ncbi:MAG TPA: TAT-variant-translocated molybdopterin oxidoreductase [Caldilineaceae bacterium]|nr:TAT-variant-translocated molybdopterin oxidoreductase [Caldilineaceae bacterium]
MSQAPLDLAAIQARLAGLNGQAYWRSLEELAETEAFQGFLYREFPRQASEWTPALSRRHFLRLMGASLALAGLTACSSRPAEKIVPYVDAPEQGVPGQPLYFATAMSLGGYALGLLAQSQMNRPTKIEGNPDHPASLGATDAWAQASVLALYDPDRATEVLREGEPSTWDAFVAELRPLLAQQRESRGAGLRILTETVTSPTLVSQLQAVLDAYPNAVWRQYEPVNRDNVYAGAALAFGEAVEPVYRLEQAEVIVSLDADLFQASPGRVRYARDFAARRRAAAQESGIHNRLYVVESAPTITGAAADHRLPLQAGQIEGFARALARELGLDVAAGNEAASQAIPGEWVGAVARDLQAHAGAGLVVAGDRQPPQVHALAHAINDALGNAGQTVVYTEPVVASPVGQTESLRELVEAMAAGQVELLLILGGNPVYTAPADLDFGAALDQVPFRAHLSLYADETSARCTWLLPESHYLEAWSDGRAYDGTVAIQQPLIAPLYASRSAHELLDVLVNETPRSGYEIVQAHWLGEYGEAGFEEFWQTALHDGVVAESALPPKAVTLRAGIGSELPAAAESGAETLEINFSPDPAVWDGRFANNGWLQELPRPLTKLTWENAALISPLTAATLGLAHGDLVELDYQGRTVQAPLWLMPGHSEGAVTVHLGYGRTRAGRVGDGAGFNAYALRTAGAPWFGPGLALRKLSAGYAFASTQTHHSMEGRNLVRVGTVEQFEGNPTFVREMDAHAPAISLYPKVEYDEVAWGMTVDLSACIGCNACVIACQAENNIPIVGKEEVAKGREMHWLRVDSYYQGDLANPAIHHQPVMCMHCENAPCEVVCPVGATMHDHEGLNTMVYNRCIGTRYCSNNCPYKVRRFNFFQYADQETEVLKLQRNPNVTVRARGVVEKCTYCVQRISAARINAKLEGRPIRDGEVVTACQAACPTGAIVFGNIADPESQVAQRKASPLNYGLLAELNTHPRTSYLARLRNPNPELEGGSA